MAHSFNPDYGVGGSDISGYSSELYGTLHGYAEDVVEICDALGRSGITFVGHSVSATLAPREVGAFVNDAIRGSRLVTLDATGHCPHVTIPNEVIAAVRSFMSRREPVAAAV